MKKLAISALALAFLLAVSFPAMGCSPGMGAMCATHSSCPSQNRPCGTTIKAGPYPVLSPKPRGPFVAHFQMFHNQATHLPETPPPRLHA